MNAKEKEQFKELEELNKQQREFIDFLKEINEKKQERIKELENSIKIHKVTEDRYIQSLIYWEKRSFIFEDLAKLGPPPQFTTSVMEEVRKNG